MIVAVLMFIADFSSPAEYFAAKSSDCVETG
jgi:hypothetical protein